MDKTQTNLTSLKGNDKAIIKKLEGGHGFQRKLRIMGIREGQTVKVDSKQPLMGPLTISVGNTQMTIGRGMAHKIIVEELW